MRQEAEIQNKGKGTTRAISWEQKKRTTYKNFQTCNFWTS